MTRVSVITGGAGGMGRATAKIVGQDHTVVLCDVRQDRLDGAVAELESLGIAATPVHCDVTDRDAVARLFETAAGIGPIASVIHTAGVSPSMGDADYVMTTNAIPAGPIETRPDGFHAVGAQAQIITDTLTAAGIELGTYEKDTVSWLSCWDWASVAVIALPSDPR